MANLYIFAIGGSGSRVLRSLTMLLASGVQTKHNIIPMIIDPDSKNGDLVRTVGEMTLYKRIHDSLTFNDDNKNKFFSSNIESLNNDGNFLLDLEGTSGIAYERYINLNGMSRENQAMMKMLFSNDNLSSTMDVGFQGNPNIGSVVLNQFTESSNYKNFLQNFVDGDKVFIVSSIFGGTGASGFPLLLKSMRTSNNNALNTAQIGAVSLLPYFNLQENTKSKIDANSFITKMKAALNYYEKNVSGNNTLDEMYYVGDQLSAKTYNNCDGGNGQVNDAHIVELIAALSIIDFDSTDLVVTNVRRTNFHEFGLATNPNGSDISFSDFGPRTQALIVKPLSQMAIINSYLNNRNLNHRISQRWAKENGNMLGEKFFKGAFFDDYRQFKEGNNEGLNPGFENWLEQLSINQKSFTPFADDETLRNTDGLEKVFGHKPHYKGFCFKKKGYDLIDERLSEVQKRIPNGLDAPSAFMELFYITTEEICANNLDIR